MREVTLEELRRIAIDSRESVWDEAEEAEREPKVYLHWTAGHYEQFFDDYHVNISGDGKYYVSTDDFSETLAHTYRRNRGGIGIAMCCAYNATTEDLGPEPPTAEQIDAMAKAIATICDAMWLTIDKEHVMTHSEAADNEDGYEPSEAYGPKADCERWDLEYLGTDESPEFDPWATDGSRGGDVLRGKSIWFRQKWRAESIGKWFEG
jgi:hypothetical protein